MTALETAPGTLRQPAPGRIRSVDGLRALAVLAVMGFHFGVGPGGGFLGVDLFFVISGFVITRLLLTRREAGDLSLREFYVRRVRRLLPALLAVLVTVQLWLWQAGLPGLRTTANAQTLAALGFASNWYTIFARVDYWSVRPGEAPLNHLWSLAVEEQFYLVWPAAVLLLVTARTGRRRLAVSAACAALLSYVLAADLFLPGAPDRAYLGTDTRAGALCLGALAACLSPSSTAPHTRAAGGPTARAAAALLVLAGLWYRADISEAALYTWQLPLAGVAAAVLVHAFAVLDHRFATGGAAAPPAILSIIGSKPLATVGAISYGLYLWHWPVWVYLDATCPHWGQPARWGAAWAASFALASLSYRLVEMPARRCRFKPLAATLALTCGLLAVGALLATAPERPADSGTPVVTGDL